MLYLIEHTKRATEIFIAMCEFKRFYFFQKRVTKLSNIDLNEIQAQNKYKLFRVPIRYIELELHRNWKLLQWPGRGLPSFRHPRTRHELKKSMYPIY